MLSIWCSKTWRNVLHCSCCICSSGWRQGWFVRCQWRHWTGQRGSISYWKRSLPTGQMCCVYRRWTTTSTPSSLCSPAWATRAASAPSQCSPAWTFTITTVPTAALCSSTAVASSCSTPLTSDSLPCCSKPTRLLSWLRFAAGSQVESSVWR